MNIESTEVKFSLTIREAQSLHAVLNAISDYKLKKTSFPIQLNYLPRGMFEDVKEIEFQLHQLLGVKI